MSRTLMHKCCNHAKEVFARRELIQNEPVTTKVTRCLRKEHLSQYNKTATDTYSRGDYVNTTIVELQVSIIMMKAKSCRMHILQEIYY